MQRGQGMQLPAMVFGAVMMLTEHDHRPPRQIRNHGSGIQRLVTARMEPATRASTALRRTGVDAWPVGDRIAVLVGGARHRGERDEHQCRAASRSSGWRATQRKSDPANHVSVTPSTSRTRSSASSMSSRARAVVACR